MTLELLNELRVAKGMKPLKAWKESKAKLVEAIGKIQGADIKLMDDISKGAATSDADLEPVELQKPKAVEFDEPTSSSHTLSLDDLARGNKKLAKELGIAGHNFGPGNTKKQIKVSHIKAGSLKSKYPSVAQIPKDKAEAILAKEVKRVETKRDSVTLTAIAKELGMDPKVARAKMRRVKVPAEHLVDGEAHTYHLKSKSWVVTQLQTDMRKKAKG